MDKRKGYVLLLINAGVRNSVRERKKSRPLLHYVQWHPIITLASKRAFWVLLLELICDQLPQEKRFQKHLNLKNTKLWILANYFSALLRKNCKYQSKGKNSSYDNKKTFSPNNEF